jgi:hypothetical protein
MISFGEDKPDFPLFDLRFSHCQKVLSRIVTSSRMLCLSFAAVIIEVGAPFFRCSPFLTPHHYAKPLHHGLQAQFFF